MIYVKSMLIRRSGDSINNNTNEINNKTSSSSKIVISSKPNPKIEKKTTAIMDKIKLLEILKEYITLKESDVIKSVYENLKDKDITNYKIYV
jgi:hypothetical protein